MSNTQRILLTLMVLLSAGCTSLQPGQRPPQASSAKVMSIPNDTVSQAPLNAPGQEVAVHALALLKSKYRYGGKSPESGLDCSGLVTHVFDSALGIPVEGSAADIAAQGRKIKRKDLQAGDLVFFNTRNRPRSHVGIYLGDGQFVHAENSRTGVRISKLTDRYYSARFEEARTILR